MALSEQPLEQTKTKTPLDSSFANVARDHKNNRLYNILKQVCFLGAVMHILYIFFFLSVGSILMSVLNVFSVLTWLLAMHQNHKARHVLATILGTAEIIIHAVLASHILGLSMGFHYFLWPAAGLIMISNLFTPIKSSGIGFAIILLFGVLTIYAHDITYEYAFPIITHYILIANIIFAALGFVIVIMSSRTKNKKNERRLYELSNKDALTATFNRQFVYDVMKQNYQERRGLKSLDYTIVIADIDNFKDINTLIGHLAGDVVIKEVANYLKSAVRETDIVARWGGEQFLIILMSVESDNAQTLIEKIRKNIRYDIVTEGLSERVTTLSFGVAKARNNEQFEDVVKRADLAMYEAKKLGKDRIIDAE